MKLKRNSTYYLIYWLPILVWAGVIFMFSSFPTGQATHIDWQDFIIKKTAHVVEYGIFAALIYRALIREGMSIKNAAVIAITASFFYGLSDEYHQSFTAGREPRLRDVGFDTIGATLAIYSIWNIIPKMPERLRKLAEKLELH